MNNSVGILDKSAKLRKRAKAKGITIGFVKELLKLDSPLQDSYKRTLFCSSTLLLQDGNLTTRYCNNRWCYVCNRIRTAKLIDGYEPILLALPELRFVTLTRPNVPGENLNQEINELTAGFRKIRDRLRKRRLLTKGVRKLEISHNQETNEFHPHFHCAISGEIEALALVKEWLIEFPTADQSAQDNRPADKLSLKELFKYCSKISANTAAVNDIIFQAIRGKRLVQPMGGIRRISEEVEDLQSSDYSSLLPAGDDVFIWGGELEDWISTEFGYFLLAEITAHRVAKINSTTTI